MLYSGLSAFNSCFAERLLFCSYSFVAIKIDVTMYIYTVLCDLEQKIPCCKGLTGERRHLYECMSVYEAFALKILLCLQQREMPSMAEGDFLWGRGEGARKVIPERPWREGKILRMAL